MPYERLEPCEGKLSRTVLRGGIGSDVNLLPDLPAHIQRLIDKSWAKDFADMVFPAINEERFSVLYSTEYSRPNTPVNVLVGSMLLKEYFGQTEEELLMSIYCDVLYQYALHLTQEEKPPVSERSWSRFSSLKTLAFLHEELLDALTMKLLHVY